MGSDQYAPPSYGEGRNRREKEKKGEDDKRDENKKKNAPFLKYETDQIQAGLRVYELFLFIATQQHRVGRG